MTIYEAAREKITSADKCSPFEVVLKWHDAVELFESLRDDEIIDGEEFIDDEKDETKS